MPERKVLTTSKRPGFIGSIGKGFAILSAFTDTRPLLSPTEIAGITGLDRTTVHRFLGSLVEIGVVAQDEDTRLYRLGLGLLDYSNTLLESLEVHRIAMSHMINVDRNGEMLALLIPDDLEIVVIERLVDQMSPVGRKARAAQMQFAGARLPLGTAAGRAILSTYSPERQADTIQRLYATDHRGWPPTADEMSERLLIIAERGYETDEVEMLHGTRPVGIRSIAAPLQGRNGIASASLSVSGEQGLGDLVQSWSERLLDLSASISHAMGYGSPTSPV